MKVRLLTSLLALVLLPTLQASTELETVLRNMDQAADRFSTLEAQVRWVKYSALVEDESAEEGVIVVRRNNDKTVDMLLEFQQPYSYFLSVQGTKVEIYRPRIAQVEEYDLSRSRETLEQALLLGFGTAGRFLRENYHVQMRGEETAAGQPTIKLELIPKSDDLLRKIPRLEMWISKTEWQPVQQKLYEINPGDYRLYTYTKIALNPALKDSAFKLKIPKNTRRVFPQR